MIKRKENIGLFAINIIVVVQNIVLIIIIAATIFLL